MYKNFTKPNAISVFVTVQPTKENGVKEAFTARIGTCKEESEVAALIAKDKAAMQDTLGGLLPPTSIKGRSYRAFRAEWTELVLK